MTVTGTTRFASSIPGHAELLAQHSFTFLPMIVVSSPVLKADLDVDTGREVETHKRIDGLRRRVEGCQ